MQWLSCQLINFTTICKGSLTRITFPCLLLELRLADWPRSLRLTELLDSTQRRPVRPHKVRGKCHRLHTLSYARANMDFMKCGCRAVYSCVYPSGICADFMGLCKGQPHAQTTCLPADKPCWRPQFFSLLFWFWEAFYGPVSHYL